MEDRLRVLIQRLAHEVQDPVSVPPELLRRSRRRILRNGVLAVAAAAGLAVGSLSGFRALTAESAPERLVPATEPAPGELTESGVGASEMTMTIIRQMVEAINGRDADSFVSAFARRGEFTVRGDFQASSSLYERTLPVSDAALAEAWMAINDAWGLEADLIACKSLTEAEFTQRYSRFSDRSDSFAHCDVATRWHRLSVEIAERWTFEFRETNLLDWGYELLALNPPARALPLGYDGLLAWEAWLEATHPEDAARYLNPRATGPGDCADNSCQEAWDRLGPRLAPLLWEAEKDWVINGHRFLPDGLIPYDPAFAEEIEASIQEYLETPMAVSPEGEEVSG